MGEYVVSKIGKKAPEEADWNGAEAAAIDFSPWEKDFPAKYASFAKLIETEMRYS